MLKVYTKQADVFQLNSEPLHHLQLQSDMMFNCRKKQEYITKTLSSSNKFRSSTATPSARTSPSLIFTPLLRSHVSNPSANGIQLDVGNAAQTRSVFVGLLGFCQHLTFALHPPCRNHELHCESTFPHGCVVEPFTQAHPPLYSCLAFFDKVQSGETLGSIQGATERKPMENRERYEKYGGW